MDGWEGTKLEHSKGNKKSENQKENLVHFMFQALDVHVFF